MSEFLDLVQSLQLALKTQLMYTASHPRAVSSIQALAGQMEEWLATRPSLHIAASNGRLFLDGAPFEGKHLHLTAMARQLTERQISGIIFLRGVTAAELAEVLEILIIKPAKMEADGGPAAVFATKTLPHVQLSQTQYKEVREGEGGDEARGGDSAAVNKPGGPADPALQAALEALAATMGAATTAPAPGGHGSQGFKGAEGPQAVPGPAQAQPSFNLEILTEQWQEQLELIPRQSLLEGDFEPAHLGFLGGTPLSFGMGDNFPPASQVEGLRRALLALAPEKLMAVVAGLDSLPAGHAGMRMGFQSLATESFTQASTALMESDTPWEQVREAMFETLRFAPQQQSMLAALETELREKGAALEQINRLQELIQQLDWENQSMEEKQRQAQEQGRLWQITLDQRLRFLRRMLDEGRVEGLLALMESILAALRSDDVSHREMAAQTLTGIARWMEDPGLPSEAEGPLIEGLTAHFGWETLAHIHRSSTEALGVVVASLVARGEPGQALALLRELSGLVAFQDNRQEWRESALAGLWAGLGNPVYLAKVTELLHTATPETMMGELIPFLDAVGLPAARFLVEVLGEEPERKRRGRLLEAIRCMGEDALPAVYEGLDSTSWYLVRNALNLLSDMGDAGALEPAQACLAHPDGRVRRAAVRALWKLGGPLALAPLLAAFPTVDPATQSEIMFALVQLHSYQAIAPLTGYAMDRRNPELLRVRAAETIGQIGDPRGIQALVEIARRKGRLFTTAEPLQVRLAACRALLALDSSLATEALCEVVAAEPWHRDRTALQQIVNDRRTS
ncbi:MAG: HEAT repeat domain-containing protein [Holophaga sp.]|nr:HEAT repeat domain-containing protein [Holophaga sp.]